MQATHPEFRQWNKCDACLLTDGSGHKDGLGGFAAVVVYPEAGAIEFVHGGSTHSSVDRQEMLALTEGLRVIDSHGGAASILWFSDRESLVGSALIDPYTGAPHYARRTNLDLWEVFNHLVGKRNARVIPHWVGRNSIAPQEWCDSMAGSHRAFHKRLRGEEDPKKIRENERQITLAAATMGEFRQWRQALQSAWDNLDVYGGAPSSPSNIASLEAETVATVVKLQAALGFKTLHLCEQFPVMGVPAE